MNNKKSRHKKEYLHMNNSNNNTFNLAGLTK